MLLTDEQQIRELQQTWLQATFAGDVATVQNLMTDDVIFLTPGRAPFGKAEFLASFAAMRDRPFDMTGHAEFEEICVADNIAYARGRIALTIAPRDGSATKQLAGHTLTVLRRESDGPWRICRDANLVTPRG